MRAWLRAALQTIHRDRAWWRTVLIGGAFMLSVIGYPLAAGLVIESMENTRRGFPTPLPPWFDWSTRYLVGLFATLIDLAFLIVPVVLAGLMVACIGLLAAGGQGAARVLLGPLLALPGLVALLVVLSSVLMVGRLLFTRAGQVEDALTGQAVRLALRPPARGVFWRARLASLPAFLPAAGLAALLAWLSRSPLPGGPLIPLVLVWLMCSALLYAQLVEVQVYIAAEREVPRVP